MAAERCAVCGVPGTAAACPRCGGRVERPDWVAPERVRGGLFEFAVGFHFALRGARLVLTRPGLFTLALLPLVLNALLFAGLCVLVFRWRADLAPDLDEAWWWGVDWLRRFLAGAGEWLIVLVGVALAFVLTWVIYPVVAAPFLELLSEAVEDRVYGHGDRRRKDLGYVWRFWILPVLQAARLAVLTGVLTLVFLALSLIPVLAPLAFLGTAWLLALSLCDVAIARKAFPARDRFRLVRADLGAWLGLALPFLFVPFLLPFGVAGATLLEIRQRRAGRA